MKGLKKELHRKRKEKDELENTNNEGMEGGIIVKDSDLLNIKMVCVKWKEMGSVLQI